MTFKKVYFDNSATTRIAPEVLESMMPFLTEEYGNPSSIHFMGIFQKDRYFKKLMKKATLLICALLLFVGIPRMYAQGSAGTPTWKGVVVDANGEPVIGAAVMIKGKTTSGAITDIDGNWSLQAKADEELVFSCLGYQTETFAAGSASARRVVLKDDTVALESAVEDCNYEYTDLQRPTDSEFGMAYLS